MSYSNHNRDEVADVPCFRVPSTSLQPGELLARLRSHLLPSQHENRALTAAAPLVRSQVDAMEMGIARLYAAIVSLENEREDALIYLERSSSLIAPVRRLPGELLSLIFSLFGLENPCSVSIKPSEYRSPASALTAVCHYWRTVALDTPEIWSNVQVIVQFPFPELEDRWRRCLTSLSTILDRSKQTELSLEIKASSFPSDAVPSDQETHPLINGLLPSCHRWKSLTLDMLYSQMHCLTPFQGKLYTLRDVIISQRATAANMPRHQISPLPYFSECVNLRGFVFNGYHGREWNLPQQQLRYVSLTGLLRISNVLEVLHASPAASTVDIMYCDPSDTDENAEDPLPFPSIKSLKLGMESGLDFRFARELFRKLTLPSLETLYIEGRGEISSSECSWPLVTDSLQTHILRSSSSISYLHISNIPMLSSHLTGLLEALPQLTSLSFHEVDNTNEAARSFGDELLMRMKYQSGQQRAVLLPVLVRLEIIANSLNAKLLIDAVQSRFRSSNSEVSRVKSVYVHIREQSIPEDVKRTAKYLRMSGLSVWVAGKGDTL